jgi:hypothetical protein
VVLRDEGVAVLDRDEARVGDDRGQPLGAGIGEEAVLAGPGDERGPLEARRPPGRRDVQAARAAMAATVEPLLEGL